MKTIKLPCIIALFIVCQLMANSSSQALVQLQPDKQNITQQKQTKYGLVGKVKAKKGKGNELASILLQAANLVSAAKGCHIYLVSKDTQDEDIVWVTEVWDSKEDHDNSLKDEKVRELIPKALPLIDGQPEKGIVLEVIGGKGIDMK